MRRLKIPHVLSGLAMINKKMQAFKFLSFLHINVYRSKSSHDYNADLTYYHSEWS